MKDPCRPRGGRGGPGSGVQCLSLLYAYALSEPLFRSPRTDTLVDHLGLLVTRAQRFTLIRLWSSWSRERTPNQCCAHTGCTRVEQNMRPTAALERSEIATRLAARTAFAHEPVSRPGRLSARALRGCGRGSAQDARWLARATRKMASMSGFEQIRPSRGAHGARDARRACRTRRTCRGGAPGVSGTCRVATHAARDAPRSPAAALREARPGRGHLSERMAESSRGKDRALQPRWEARPALRQRFAAAVSQQQQAARARSGRKAQRGGQVTLATFRCASSVRGVSHRSHRCHRHATARSAEGCAARSHRLHLLEAVCAHDGVRVAAEL